MTLRDTYQTPENFRTWFKDNFFMPTLDVAADADNYFSNELFIAKQEDGLNQKWHGKVWCNPPYSSPNILNFCKKAIEEKNNCEAIALLLPGDFSTKWFQLIESECHVYLLSPRIQFKAPDGIKSSSNPHCSLLAHFGGSIPWVGSLDCGITFRRWK